MATPTKGPRLGGTPAHQRIILNNLASQLFEHGKITTTETRAKRVQPVAERLIAKAKRGDLHNRRQVLAAITDKSVVHSLFNEIAPQMAGREGGYTRITKLGNRKGDNAPMALLELVLESVKPKKPSKKSEAKKVDDAQADEVKEASVEEAKAEEAPVEEAKAEEAPVDEAKAEEAPVDEAEVADAESPVDSTETETTVEQAAKVADEAKADDKSVKGGEASK